MPLTTAQLNGYFANLAQLDTGREARLPEHGADAVRQLPAPQLLQFFRSSAFPEDGSGGLTTTCPATFASCVPKL